MILKRDTARSCFLRWTRRIAPGLKTETAPKAAALQRLDHGGNGVTRSSAARAKAELAGEEALLALYPVETDLLAEPCPAEGADIADPVDKAEIDRLFTDPDVARKEFLVFAFFKPLAAPRFHDILEGIVNVALDFLQPFDVLGLFGAEGIELHLIFPRRINAPVNPELVEERRKAKA